MASTPTLLITPINDSTIEIDADVLVWFKTHNVNYQDRINQLLRDHIKHELVK